MATAVLSIGLISLAASVLYAQRLNIAARETSLAIQSAKGMIETMRTQDFRQLFFTFNDNPADDPGGNGSAPGDRFAVPGLAGLAGQAAGRITLNLDETVLNTDLNGDGDILDTVDNSDVEDSYQLLPVTVDVTWVGTTGRKTIRVATELSTDVL